MQVAEYFKRTKERQTNKMDGIYLIGPDLAHILLNRNLPNNRHLRPHQVARYAEDMRYSRWFFTGDPIRFSSSGALVDGQHRIQAVVQAGVEIPFQCLFGIEPNAVDVIDTGVPRSLADSLKMYQASFPGPLAQMLRYIVAWKEQRLESLLNRQSPAPTRSACLSAHLNDPSLSNYLGSPLLKSAIVRTGLGHGIGAFVLWLLSSVNREEAERFFAELANGGTLTETDPVFCLRKRLETCLASRKALSSVEKISMCLTAWNMRMSGTKTQRLIVRKKIPVDKSVTHKRRIKRMFIAIPHPITKPLNNMVQ